MTYEDLLDIYATKHCKICAARKPLSDFYKTKIKYYSSYCKPCFVKRVNSERALKRSYVVCPHCGEKLKHYTRIEIDKL